MSLSKMWFDVDLHGQLGKEEYRVFGSIDAVNNWITNQKIDYGYLDASINEAEPCGAEFTTHRKVKVI
jgi:hypothetical protein